MSPTPAFRMSSATVSHSFLDRQYTIPECRGNSRLISSMISFVMPFPFFSLTSYCRLARLKLERNHLGFRMPSW